MVDRALTLDGVLTHLMEQRRWSVAELAATTGIPVRTLENWRSGEVARPRHVADLLTVAATLGLSACEADTLLTAAQHPPLAVLAAQAHHANDLPRLAVLAQWVAQEPHGVATTSDPVAQLLRMLPEGLQLKVQRMVEDYRMVFGGRAVALATLDRWLAHPAHPYAFLHAPTGRGKTALLIHWALQVLEQGTWTVIFVPISLRYGTATELAVLTALGTALARVHGEAANGVVAGLAPEQLRLRIAAALRHTPPRQRLLLILDGLDEAIGWQMDSLLFPSTPPPGLRIVGAAREKAGTTPAHWYAQLGWAMRHVADLSLGALDPDAISAVLTQSGATNTAWATDSTLPSAIFHASAGDPLTVRLLIEALQAGTLAPTCLSRLPPGFAAYLEHWLNDLRQHSRQAAAVYVLLGLCAVALGPLTTADLAALAPEHFARGVDVQAAVAAVDRFIVGDGSAAYGYVFSHGRLRELFVDHVLSPQEWQALHARFVAYGQRWYAERTTPLPAYLRLFWITHLIDGDHWAQVHHVLTEVVWWGDTLVQPWSAARLAAEGNAAGYLADLDRLWTHAETSHDVVTGVHCALLTSTMHSLSSNLPPALLVGLVTVGTPEGTWTIEAALAHIRHMPDAHHQAAALIALAPVATADQLPHLLDLAMQLPSHLITSGDQVGPATATQHADRLRAEVLQHLAAALPAQVLAAVHAITDPVAQVRVLVAVAAGYPPAARRPLYDAALATLAGAPDPQTQADILLTLVSYIPELVLPLAHALLDVATRTYVLAALVPYLAPECQAALVVAVLAALDHVADRSVWVRALTALAPVVPQQVLLAAQTIPEVWARAAVSIALAPHCAAAAVTIVQDNPPVEVLVAVAPYAPDAVLTRVQQQGTAWEQAQVLMALAPHRPAAVLELAQELADTGLRLHVLARLVASMPAPRQTAMAAELVGAIQRVGDPSAQGAILCHLLPYQPNMVWTVARTLSQRSAQVDVLLVLARAMPPAIQPVIYAEALAASRHIADSLAWSTVLCAFARHIPTAVLTAVATLPDVRAQVRVLVALAPYLPDAVLTAATQLADTNAELEVLLALGPELPDAVRAVLEQIPPGRKRDAVLQDLLVLRGGRMRVAHGGMGVRGIPRDRPQRGHAEVLMALAPQHPVAVQAAARQLADALARARVLATVAAQLPVGAQRAGYAEALGAAMAVAPSAERVAMLMELAPHLATHLAHPTWSTTLRAAAAQGRCSLLSDLTALLPWLGTLTTPAQQAALVATMQRVWSAWP